MSAQKCLKAVNVCLQILQNVHGERIWYAQIAAKEQYVIIRNRKWLTQKNAHYVLEEVNWYIKIIMEKQPLWTQANIHAMDAMKKAGLKWVIQTIMFHQQYSMEVDVRVGRE